MTHQDPTALPTATDAASLLEQANTQWQTGDWHSLAQLQRDTLQHHPDRAHLALLAAAGRLQMGKDAEAKPFIRLAQEWGASKQHIGQMLIAGVHNSIGRAAELGNQKQRAQRHFESAAAISPALNMDTSMALSLFPLSKSIEILTQELKKQNTELSEKITQQNTDLAKLRKQLESTVKKEMLNATQQLEAFLNIQSFFTHGEHQPIMHGWPISPDFALYLIELLEKNDYDLILEFGSGTSTVIIAKALARLNSGRSRPAVIQVAFEHLEQYHAQTLANLQSAGMADAVQLVLAPLQPYAAPNGKTYPYYACHEKLAELASSKQAPNSKILVVVDGPPGSTGKHARYPALPAILTHFKNNQIDMLLDDYNREDEKEISNLWIKDFELAGFKTQTEKIKMEKDAFFITATRII